MAETDYDRQQAEIEGEIKKQPLVGPLESSFESLRSEFAGNEPFLRKIPHLENFYPGIRRARGDGNCFFTAFSYRLFENLLFLAPDNSTKNYNLIRQKFEKTLDYLGEAGYDTSMAEFFHEVLLEDYPSKENFKTFFSDDNSCVNLAYVLRLLAGAYIKLNWSKFSPFVSETSADAFCKKHVEGAYVPAGQIVIQSICQYFGVAVVVQYLDRNDSDQTTEHVIEVDEENQVQMENRICLLYRPEHYDILYEKKQEGQEEGI